MRLIDADALKKQFEEVYPLSTNEMGCIINNSIYDIIDNAPTLPNPCGSPCNFTIPTGRWIDDKCSVCGKGIEDLISSPEWYKDEMPNYCPFCGVKIEEAKNE